MLCQRVINAVLTPYQRFTNAPPTPCQRSTKVFRRTAAWQRYGLQGPNVLRHTAAQTLRTAAQSPPRCRARKRLLRVPLKIPGFQPSVRAYRHHTTHELFFILHPHLLQRRRR